MKLSCEASRFFSLELFSGTRQSAKLATLFWLLLENQID